MPWVVVGVLCIVGGALAFALYARSISSREPVLAVARQVAAGQVIQDGDLRVIGVSADSGLKPLGANNRRAVVGRTAGVDLVPGTLLTADHIASADSSIGAGQVLVAMVVKAEQAPLFNLRAGDRVVIIDTGSGDDPPRVLVPDARVFAARLGNNNTNAHISVVVEELDGRDVAAAAAAGRISLALLGT